MSKTYNIGKTLSPPLLLCLTRHVCVRYQGTRRFDPKQPDDCRVPAELGRIRQAGRDCCENSIKIVGWQSGRQQIAWYGHRWVLVGRNIDHSVDTPCNEMKNASKPNDGNLHRPIIVLFYHEINVKYHRQTQKQASHHIARPWRLSIWCCWLVL